MATPELADIVRSPCPERLISWDRSSGDDLPKDYYLSEQQEAESNVAGAIMVATEILEKKGVNPWSDPVTRQAASFLNSVYIQGYLACLKPDPQQVRIQLQIDNRTRQPYQDLVRNLLAIPGGHYALIRAFQREFGDFC